MALLTHGIEPDGRQRKESRRPDHELHRSEVLLQRAQEAREITKTVVIDSYRASQSLTY